MYPGTWAATTPDKPALVMAGSGRTLTYAELDDRSLRLARHLLARGLARGDVVALLSDNTPEAYEVYWAALRSGLYVRPSTTTCPRTRRPTSSATAGRRRWSSPSRR